MVFVKDWMVCFGWYLKEGVCLFLIMWFFGLVVLVYDVVDMEGSEFLEDVFSFVV